MRGAARFRVETTARSLGWEVTKVDGVLGALFARGEVTVYVRYDTHGRVIDARIGDRWVTGAGKAEQVVSALTEPPREPVMPSPKVLTQAITSGYDLDKEIEVGSVPPFEPGVVIVKAVDDEKCVRVKLTPDEADSLAEMLRAVAAHARDADRKDT